MCKDFMQITKMPNGEKITNDAGFTFHPKSKEKTNMGAGPNPAS
jgi:hypothetical protein